MRTHVSSVTLKELSYFFKGSHGSNRDDKDNWRSVVDDGILTAWSGTYNVKVEPDSTLYYVKIKDKDNSSDSDESITDNPVEFIIDFISTGTLGDEYFKNRMSMSPDDLCSTLLHLSSSIDNGSIGPKRLFKTLRRAMAIMAGDIDVTSVRKIFSTVFGLDDDEIKDIANLRADMAEKGWKVKVDGDDYSTVMTVDIGEIFEATVSVDHLLWNYQFGINGTDILKEGVTEDPIAAFQDFCKSESVQKAKAAQKAKKRSPDLTERPTKPFKKPDDFEHDM